MVMRPVEDALTRSAFSSLFKADSQEAMELAFDQLRQLGESFQVDAKKAEDEARRKRGIVRSLPSADLEAGAEMWAQIAAQGAVPTDPEDDE